VHTFNEAFSTLSTRRRYEVWFLRLGLASGEGAWWFRYLLMNPGQNGCRDDVRGMPAQVWATWFPREGRPQSFIQGFPLQTLALSAKGHSPFELRIAENVIGEDFCRGALNVDGRSVSWALHYRSTFHTTLSSKGWIGFSRTPHSDATFSGQITVDGRSFEGDPLGFGLQGHNCGYRHRHFWTWAHAYFERRDARPSTLEALVYEMPLGFVFRKVILWHEGEQFVFRNLGEVRREANPFLWNFRCENRDGLGLTAVIDGTRGAAHRLPYLRTNCRDAFEVVNNSLSAATLRVERRGALVESLETSAGAVLEMVG
jgi:hypothetical protein